MNSKRLNLADFKLKKVVDEKDVSKLMGRALADCHDGEYFDTTKGFSLTNAGGKFVPDQSRRG